MQLCSGVLGIWSLSTYVTMEHIQFTQRLGTNDLYTLDGDYVATFKDEHKLSDILELVGDAESYREKYNELVEALEDPDFTNFNDKDPFIDQVSTFLANVATEKKLAEEKDEALNEMYLQVLELREQMTNQIKLLDTFTEEMTKAKLFTPPQPINDTNTAGLPHNKAKGKGGNK